MAGDKTDTIFVNGTQEEWPKNSNIRGNEWPPQAGVHS